MVITLPLLFWGLSPPSSTDLPEGGGMPPDSPGSGIAAVDLALELGSTTLNLMLFRLLYLKLMPRSLLKVRVAKCLEASVKICPNSSPLQSP